MPEEDQTDYQQPAPSRTQSHVLKGIIFILLGFLLLFGGAYAGYWYRARQSRSAQGLSPATRTASNICVKEKGVIEQVINRFEGLQKNRDAAAVLALFTSPVTSEEIDTYEHLSGADAAGPRLYSSGETNFVLADYDVLTDPQEHASGGCVLKVNETRKYYRQGIGGYLPEKSVATTFVLKKEGGAWLVDSYMARADTGKYGGFVLPAEVPGGSLAGWGRISSARCGFEISYPNAWYAREVELVPGTDDPKLRYGCVAILAPDYDFEGEKKIGSASPKGFYINISRTELGARFKSIEINSLEGYIKAEENVWEPSATIDYETVTIGSVTGYKYIFGGFETLHNFIFRQGNYIFTVSWPVGHEENYGNSENIDQILSTFRLLD